MAATEAGVRVARVSTDEPETGTSGRTSLQPITQERPDTGHSALGAEERPMLNGTRPRAAEVPLGEGTKNSGQPAVGQALQETRPNAGDSRQLVPASLP